MKRHGVGRGSAAGFFSLAKHGELQNDPRLRRTSIRNACGANKVNTHLDLHAELLCTYACTFLRTNGKKRQLKKCTINTCSQDSTISCYPHRDSWVETCLKFKQYFLDIFCMQVAVDIPHCSFGRCAADGKKPSLVGFKLDKW